MKGIGTIAVIAILAVIAVGGVFAGLYFYPQIIASRMVLADRVATGYHIINQYDMIRDNLKVLVPFQAKVVANELGRKGGCKDCRLWSKNGPSLNKLIQAYSNETKRRIELPKSIGPLGEIQLDLSSEVEVEDLFVKVDIPTMILSAGNKLYSIIAGTDENLVIYVPLRYRMLLSIGRMLLERGVWRIYPYFEKEDEECFIPTEGEKMITVSTPVAQGFIIPKRGYLTKIKINVSLEKNAILYASVKGDLSSQSDIATLVIPPSKRNYDNGLLVLDFDDFFIEEGIYYLVLDASNRNISMEVITIPFCSAVTCLYVYNETSGQWKKRDSISELEICFAPSKSKKSNIGFLNDYLCGKNKSGNPVYCCSDVKNEKIKISGMNISSPINNWFQYALLCGLKTTDYVVEQPTNSSSLLFMCFSDIGCGEIAQSFKLDHDYYLDSIEVYVGEKTNVSGTCSSDTLNVTLIEGTPLNKEREIEFNSIRVYPNSWNEIKFSGIYLEKGKTYSFVLKRDCVTYILYNESSNSYKRGSVFAKNYSSSDGSGVWVWEKGEGDLMFRLHLSGPTNIKKVIEQNYAGIEFNYTPLKREIRGNAINILVNITDNTTEVPKKGQVKKENLQLSFKTKFYRPLCDVSGGDICKGFTVAKCGPQDLESFCIDSNTLAYNCEFSGWKYPWTNCGSRKSKKFCSCCEKKTCEEYEKCVEESDTQAYCQKQCNAYCEYLGYNKGKCSSSDNLGCENISTRRFPIYNTGDKANCRSRKKCYCYNLSPCDIKEICQNNECKFRLMEWEYGEVGNNEPCIVDNATFVYCENNLTHHNCTVIDESSLIDYIESLSSTTSFSSRSPPYNWSIENQSCCNCKNCSLSIARVKFYFDSRIEDKEIWLSGNATECNRSGIEGIYINDNFYLLLNGKLIYNGTSYGAKDLKGDQAEHEATDWCVEPINLTGKFKDGWNELIFLFEDYCRKGGVGEINITIQ